MDKLTISRILVENKYLLPVTKADTGVHVVDIPKAAEVLNELFQQKLKQCNVIQSLPIDDILGLDQPWPLVDVLKKLIEASDILLHKHSYDGHGWEEISHAVEIGKQKVDLLYGNAV